MLTINGTTTTNLSAYQHGATFFTGLTLAAIHQQMILIIAFITLTVLIITEGGAAIFYALGNHGVNGLVQLHNLSMC